MDPATVSIPKIKSNGTNITPVVTYETNSGGDFRHPYIFTFTYELTISEDITIKANLNPSSDYRWGGIDIVSQPAATGGTEYDDVLYDTYTVSSSNSWKYTVRNLPTTGEIDGEEVTYSYYVKEMDVPGNTEDTYENNDGVTSGAIIIKNQVNETPYELPETGNNLLFAVEVSGAALVIISIIGLFLRRKNRKKY